MNDPRMPPPRPRRRVQDTRVNMAHGSGGKAMRDLIEDVFLDAFDNPLLAPLEDQATTYGRSGGCAHRHRRYQGGRARRRRQLFINTAGIGVIRRGISISAGAARPGDVVIVNGNLGDHGAAILIARKQLALESDIPSDCRPLNSLIDAMLEACPDIHCLRDATRGGVATVLNEFAQSSKVCIRLREPAIPLREEVKGACEILGHDPLYLANEGKLVAMVPADAAPRVLAAMRAHPDGADAAIIGEVRERPSGSVILETGFGGQRIVDMLVGEQLPRIC